MFHDIKIDVDSELLEVYRIAAIIFKTAKENELKLRNQITDIILEGLEVGTHNFATEEFLIKAVKSFNYTFDKETLQGLIDEEALSEEELDLIRWKPELKLADYKNANFETESLDEALFVKPAQPTLEIKIGEV